MDDWTLPSDAGYATLPEGVHGTVETSLERFQAPDPTGWPLPDGYTLKAAEPFNLDAFKALYHAVGDPWLWHGRLLKSDAEIEAIANAPTTHGRYLVNAQNEPVGLFEAQHQGEDTLEVTYFGLVPEATGKRLGPAMMENGLAQCWSPTVKRIWLHTCTFDSPFALGFYQRMGFKPFRQRFEWGKDPRLMGVLPRHVAPHIPLADFSKP